VSKNVDLSLSEKLLVLVASTIGILLAWFALRYWLESAKFNISSLRFIDVGIVAVTGIAATILFVRLTARTLAARAGPTQTNAIKLLFQLLGVALVIVAVVFLTGPTGADLVSALVGVGFFGIVFGLAAQAVLGNVFSGLMLLASRPFHVNDRIALITWTYGKFPPSLTHGWLEPSYTGVVKGIGLAYTKILTDSNALLKVPNSNVTASLIMNLSHGRQGHVAMQVEVPIAVDPDNLRKRLNTLLSEMKEFKGEEVSFDILEMSSFAYLLALNYTVDRQNEAEMRWVIFRALRLALTHPEDKASK
jgi:small-conductance mechanosensitive channel